ncbi:MAG TPA: MFS transporter [Patescibacteria group bacterium]|nr:MFS transporter [Patescibacteria group bacterium]
MNAIKTRIRRELSHFTSLPQTARLLTLSYLLRSIAYPLMSIFTGAYIWRTTSDVTLLILYFMGNFLALPIMFSLNRLLLRRIPLKHLYLLGTVLAGFGPILVIFQRHETILSYFLYGFVYGIGNGLYWANRNFLTLTHTTSQTRSYFTGLQFTLSTLAYMAVPPLAGWFVVVTQNGYELVALTASLIFIASGLVMRGNAFAQPDVTPARTPLSRTWNTARLLTIAIGCVDSVIYILPTVLILSTLGNEVVLGWVNGLAALLSAAASYVVGRKYRQSMYTKVFTAMLVGFAVAGLPLFWGIGVLTVAWYLLISTVVDSVIWIANEPVLMDMMDDEVKRSGTTLYRLIIERERYLNIGRISMLLLLLVATLVVREHAIAIAATASGIVGLGIAGVALRKRGSFRG